MACYVSTLKTKSEQKETQSLKGLKYFCKLNIIETSEVDNLLGTLNPFV